MDFHSFVNKTRHAIGALHLTRYTYVYLSLSLSLSLSSSLSSPLPLSLNSSFPTSHKFTSINLQFEYGDERPFPASKTVLAHIQREIRTKVSLYFLTRLSRISLVTTPFGNRWKYCITSGESLIFIPSPLHR